MTSVVLCSALFFFYALVSMTTAKPFNEAYWEAWNMDKTNDYCSSLPKIPATPVGSTSGVNIVDLSFGDYTFGTDNKGRITIGYINQQVAPDGTSFDVDDLISGVNSIHSKGGLVKLSFGGATFSMGTHIQTIAQADAFAQNVSIVVKQDGLDGVDFDVEDGNPPANIQLEVFSSLRKYFGSTKLISYTIPALCEQSDPWKTVLQQGHSYFDTINVMAYDVYWSGYNFTYDVSYLEGFGVTPKQIVYGIMPGNHDAPNEYTSVTDAQNIAKYVKSSGFGGVMQWDLNRDTNHRTGCSSGTCETYQPDGTYINAVSQSLNT